MADSSSFRFPIALDIDDTIAYAAGRLIELITRQFPRLFEANRERSGPGSHNSQRWNSPEVRAWTKELILNPDYYLNISPIAGAAEALQSLQDIIEVKFYISGRPKSLDALTMEWLKEHGFPEAFLESQPDESAVEDRNRWKASVLARRVNEIYGVIDDHPNLISSLPPTFSPTIFLYGNISPKTTLEVVRIPSWKEATEIIREYFELLSSEQLRARELVKGTSMTASPLDLPSP